MPAVVKGSQWRQSGFSNPSSSTIPIIFVSHTNSRSFLRICFKSFSDFALKASLPATTRSLVVRGGPNLSLQEIVATSTSIFNQLYIAIHQ